MIQPLGMINSTMPMITPIQFKAQKQNQAFNALNSKTQAQNFNSCELCPEIKSSTMGQKLDFFA